MRHSTSIPSSLFASALLLACATRADDPTDDAPSVHVETDTVGPSIFTTIGPISDESSRSSGSCPDQKAVYGMQCTGRYCDNIYLFCENIPSSAVLSPSRRWYTPWFSEENSGRGSCETGPYGVPGLITGVECAGRYCDNMRLECAALDIGTIWMPDWAPVFSFSEEQPAQLFNGPAIRLACFGRYCDRLEVKTAGFGPPNLCFHYGERCAGSSRPCCDNVPCGPSGYCAYP